MPRRREDEYDVSTEQNMTPIPQAQVDLSEANRETESIVGNKTIDYGAVPRRAPTAPVANEDNLPVPVNTVSPLQQRQSENERYFRTQEAYDTANTNLDDVSSRIREIESRLRPDIFGQPRRMSKMERSGLSAELGILRAQQGKLAGGMSDIGLNDARIREIVEGTIPSSLLRASADVYNARTGRMEARTGEVNAATNQREAEIAAGEAESLAATRRGELDIKGREAGARETEAAARTTESQARMLEASDKGRFGSLKSVMDILSLDKSFLIDEDTGEMDYRRMGEAARSFLSGFEGEAAAGPTFEEYRKAVREAPENRGRKLSDEVLRQAYDARFGSR